MKNHYRGQSCGGPVEKRRQKEALQVVCTSLRLYGEGDPAYANAAHEETQP
jgi:hypothetical protein